MRRAYIEGFEQEELISYGDSDSPSSAPGAGSTPREDLSSASVGDFAAMGLSEVTVNPDGTVQRERRPGR